MERYARRWEDDVTFDLYFHVRRYAEAPIPDDEALWTRLVELRLAAGDRVGARRALGDARAALERELGLAGDRVLEDVAERLT